MRATTARSRRVDASPTSPAATPTLGITDIVVHHPRAEDPNWDDPPDVLDAIAADVLPRLQRRAG